MQALSLDYPSCRLLDSTAAQELSYTYHHGGMGIKGGLKRCALSQNSDRAHYPRYSTIRGNFQIVAIYKDFKEISSDNVTTILESPATDSPFSVLQNFLFAGRTISRSNPGYACSQSPVKAQRTVRS